MTSPIFSHGALDGTASVSTARSGTVNESPG